MRITVVRLVIASALLTTACDPRHQALVVNDSPEDMLVVFDVRDDEADDSWALAYLLPAHTEAVTANAPGVLQARLRVYSVDGCQLVADQAVEVERVLITISPAADVSVQPDADLSQHHAAVLPATEPICSN